MKQIDEMGDTGPTPEYTIRQAPKGRTELESQITRWLLRVALAGGRVDSERFARQIGYSTAHADRLCRELLGETARGFVARLRLEMSAGQLASEGPSVKEVYGLAGYRARQSFVRAFTEHFECSPSEFRAANRNLAPALPGFLAARGIVPRGPLSVGIQLGQGRTVTYMFDGMIFLGRVLGPGGRIDWRSAGNGRRMAACGIRSRGPLD